MRLLVLGASSQLGLELVKLLESQGVEHQALTAEQVDLLKEMDVVRCITQYEPDQVINVAAYANLEKAETDAQAARLCDEINTQGVSTLAQVCDHLNIPLIHHSTSYVFDGIKAKAYTEEDRPNPTCRYGLSKWFGEEAIRQSLKRHVILRTDWVFSPHRDRFFRLFIDAFKAGKGKLEVMEHRFSPTPAEDVARVVLAMARQIDCHAEVWGTFHYCSLLPVNQQQFVESILKEAAQYDSQVAALLEHLAFQVVPVIPPYIHNSVLEAHKIMETFGIKQRSRSLAVTQVLEGIYGIDKQKQAELAAAEQAELALAREAEAAAEARRLRQQASRDRRARNKANAKSKSKSPRAKDARQPAKKGAGKKVSPQP